jgi:hypothetical protein
LPMPNGPRRELDRRPTASTRRRVPYCLERLP